MRSIAHRLMLLWGWQRLAAAFLAGALSALALRPLSLAPVLLLTFPALVYLVDGAVAGGRRGLRRLLPAAATGWWFGFGYFLAGLYWVGAAFLAEGPELAPLMPVAVLLLAGGLALFPAFGIALARLLWTDGPTRILSLSFGLGLAEWLRGHLFTGFPWNLFGQAVAFTDVTAQAAAVVGVYGLTALGILVFAAPALLGDEPDRQGPRRLILAVAVLLVVADVGYGLHRLAGAAPRGAATVDGATVRIVQPNIDQAEKWSPEFRAATLARLRELSDAKTGPDTLGAISFSQIIWPETALPFFLTQEPEALEAIADLLPPGTSLVTGAPRMEPDDGDGRRFYNSVFAIDDTGAILDAYDKIHLVPFGEYMPFAPLLERLGVGGLFKGVGGFSSGPRRRIMHVARLPSFAVLICYEAIFPGEVETADGRPDYYINVTNDGWFGRTSGPYQHLDEVRLRAIEEGRPILRAANTGISAIVDGYGRVVASLPLGVDGVLDGAVPAERPSAPFPQVGGWLLLTYYVFLAIALTAVRRKRGPRS